LCDAVQGIRAINGLRPSGLMRLRRRPAASSMRCDLAHGSDFLLARESNQVPMRQNMRQRMAAV
jgi:hypothetical protein